MKLIVKCCYSQLLWVLCSGETFSTCVDKVSIISGPHHNYEGMAGYIETDVEFVLKDLTKFANLWTSYYTLTDKRRLDLYGLAKGLGDCK